MNKLTVNITSEDEIERIVCKAVNDNPEKFVSYKDGVLYVAPDGIQETKKRNSLEDALLDMCSQHTPFSIETLRYAYEDSFDDLLKAVALAQELGSDNLVKCMKSALVYKHGGLSGGEAIRDTEDVIHPSQLMQLSTAVAAPAAQDAIREYAKMVESFSLVARETANEWEMIVSKWRESDHARHVLSIVEIFKTLNPQAYMSSDYHVILARQAYAKRYNYLHPSRRISWRRLSNSQVDEACWEWLNEHER